VFADVLIRVNASVILDKCDDKRLFFTDVYNEASMLSMIIKTQMKISSFGCNYSQ